MWNISRYEETNFLFARLTFLLSRQSGNKTDICNDFKIQEKGNICPSKMISTNDLSMFILYHNLYGLTNKSLCLIQNVMRASELSAEKYKRMCEDFPNLAILTKSATPAEIQLTFDHSAFVNKCLGESVVAFSLAGNLSSPSVISLKIEIAFAADGSNIRLPIAEVLLRAADVYIR